MVAVVPAPALAVVVMGCSEDMKESVSSVLVGFLVSTTLLGLLWLFATKSGC